MSGGTHRRVLHRYQSLEIKILNIYFPRIEIEPTTYRACAPALRLALTQQLV